jgi:predicted SAM-dependent methyltransferase
VKETTKAMKRRNADTAFDWKSVFAGHGLDVGSGDDPLPGAVPLDQCVGDQLDANLLTPHFGRDTFDYIHASQLLEHLEWPMKSLRDWSEILKPEGYIVFTVPDFVLYEKAQWPSNYNSDHKTAWTLDLLTLTTQAPLIYVPNFLKVLSTISDLKTLRCELITTNYDYSISSDVDQTCNDSGTECFIEIVLQKIPKKTKNN